MGEEATAIFGAWRMGSLAKSHALTGGGVALRVAGTSPAMTIASERAAMTTGGPAMRERACSCHCQGDLVLRLEASHHRQYTIADAGRASAVLAMAEKLIELLRAHAPHSISGAAINTTVIRIRAVPLRLTSSTLDE